MIGTALAAITIANSAISAGNLWNSWKNSKNSSRLAREQYNLQLQSEYSNQLATLNELYGQQSQTQLAIKQEQANIGSNYDYLNRWNMYADSQLNQAESESKSAYRQLADNYASLSENAGETGRVGGSMSRIAGREKSDFENYVGDSLKYGTGEGSLGLQKNSLLNDLVTERSNAIASIFGSQSSIDTYNSTLTSLSDTIQKQKKITEDIGAKL